ncbi:MAG: purine-binding chemotaxis protein CheW [Deltaproteobacteria bacterium]|nr:purine-binding chemotaxis protein CheW [Deltaproteobacteria bacterium]
MRPPPQQAARFSVGGTHFGLDIMQIKEIIEPQPVKPVPRAPRFIDGVIEVRGAVIPVLELSKRFGTSPAADPAEKRFIITSLAGKLLALGADSVTEIIRIDPQGWRPVPSLLRRPETRCITGVARSGRDLVMVLDLAGLLRSEDPLDLGGMQALVDEAGTQMEKEAGHP